MKNILILGLLISSLPSLACRNNVPESEAQRYISAASAGYGAAGLYSCKDRPSEKCLCLDHLKGGWDTAKIVTDSNGVRLEDDLDKLAAKKSKEDLDASNQAIKESKKAMAVLKLGDFDPNASYTNEQLKQFIQALITRGE